MKPLPFLSDAEVAAAIPQVVKHLGKTLKPEALKFVRMLPKTRSAKIVRGVIRRRFLNEPAGDLASVENPDAVEAIARAR